MALAPIPSRMPDVRPCYWCGIPFRPERTISGESTELFHGPECGYRSQLAHAIEETMWPGVYEQIRTIQREKIGKPAPEREPGSVTPIDRPSPLASAQEDPVGRKKAETVAEKPPVRRKPRAAKTVTAPEPEVVQKTQPEEEGGNAVASLKEVREFLGLSQQAFAERLGVSRGVEWQWESGRKEMPEEIAKKVERLIEQRAVNKKS